MHANRNQKALKRVEKGMMKANRVRNLFAVLAVILTTFMITTVFSLGINYMENMDLMAVRTAGTCADVVLSAPTARQEQQIRSLSYVKTIGKQYFVGSSVLKNAEGREQSILIQYYDSTEWEEHFKGAASNIKGSYPLEENEIMLSENALSQLGISDPRLHMDIPLSFSDRDGDQKKTFSLSGWFTSYTETGMGFVSESYCENAGYSMSKDGILSLSLKEMPEDFYRIQRDVTLNEDQNFDGAVSVSSANGSVIAVLILLVLFIVGSGYLLIYNVLYISISQNTRFYGLIKTLGTTRKQIRSLVKKQAFRFACIGIPAGILMAAAVSFGLVPFALQQGYESGRSSMDAVVFFHPSIFILSVVFSAVTVWMACNTPAKTAARISPVEALRFQNFAPKKTGSRASSNGGKLHMMAFHNVFRDRKRALLVFMSLFMGTVTILGVNGILGSISADSYVAKYTDYDFRYIDGQFTQYEQPDKEVPQFDRHFVEQLTQIDGIRSITVDHITWAGIRFDEAALESFLNICYEDSTYKRKGKSYEQMVSELKRCAEEGSYGCYVSTLDDSAVEQYNASHEAPIDIQAFRRGELIIVGNDSGTLSPNAALVGKTLNLTSDNPDGTSADFLVGGAFRYDDYEKAVNIGHRKYIGIVPDIIYVSPAGMKRLTQSSVIYSIGINIHDPDDLRSMDSRLQEVNSTLPTGKWDFISSVGISDMWSSQFYSLAFIGNGAAVLLILIGLMNFVNVMLTGVVARKNEFAIMESIGTSKKQIRTILTLEGGFYALISTVLIMTLGNAFLWLVASAVPHMVDYARFEYPVRLVVCLITAVFVICLTVPSLVYRTISKETVIQRLHDFQS